MEELLKYLEQVLGEGADSVEVANKVKGSFNEYLKQQSGNLAKERDDFKTKNGELSVLMQELQEKYKDFEENEVSFDNFKQLQEDFEALKNSAENTDTTKIFEDAYNKGKASQQKSLEPEFKKLQDKISTLTETTEKYTQKYIDFNKKKALDKAIKDMGIQTNEFVLDGLNSRMQSEYDEIEDTFMHRMYHDGTYIPLSDFIIQFPQTEVGKDMIPAPLNTGGGSPGSRTTGRGRYRPEDIPNLSKEEQVVALKELGYIT